MESRYTQIEGGGRACVYNIRDYDVVLTCLKNCKGVEIEKIPFSTLNIIQRLQSLSMLVDGNPAGLNISLMKRWMNSFGCCEKALGCTFTFPTSWLKIWFEKGGRSLIADEMALVKHFRPHPCCLPAICVFMAEELERWMPFVYPLRSTLIKAVLDVAEKVKRIVLLSGTPSLSRPGLLGQNKYDFAKTYCAVRAVCTYEAKGFQDFSKGIRLEELNVLLRQTVMEGSNHIKVAPVFGRNHLTSEHVAIVDTTFEGACTETITTKTSANNKTAAEKIRYNISKGCKWGGVNHDASERNAAEAINSENVDGSDASGGCCRSKKLSYQELGIAKLSGFCEWLSIHPLISDGVAKLDANHSAQKMIIFAHHLKVLDGVQEFVCEKGVGFVRIDGNTLASDRQNAPCVFALPQYGILLILLLEILVFNSCWGDAVQGCSETDFYGHFRDVGIVKIAIIGITAGGVGLDFSSAQNVVFLELPQSPSLMLQAEDRAHRRGQSNAVNIYIFCAKDTLDETRWQNLNKSLHRVSSTMDGKYDAVPEILVERISYFGKSDKGIRGSSEVQVELPDSGSVWNSQPFKTHNEENAVMVLDNVTDKDFVAKKNLEGVSDIEIRSSSRDSSSSDGHEGNDQSEKVSKYTGRIHLYSCILGKDSRPQPLYENFQPEELESLASNDSKETDFKFLKQNPVSRHALLSFIKEWNALRPIERRKLCGKTLQLPLHVELCYLNESTNHRIGGLLKGGSKRRCTPLGEISHPLPSNAILKKVHLSSSYGQKEKQYTQGWTLMDEPLCKLCQMPCKGSDAKTPRYFEDLFCDLICCEEYRIRTSSRSLRQRRREYIEEAAPNVASQKKLLDKLANNPCEGNAWHAYHIVPVYRGGGECKLENIRTLCVACHSKVTAAQRVNDAQPGKRLGSNLKADDMGKGLTFSDKFSPKDQQINVRDTSGQGHSRMREEDLVDELLVKVPGSAYSGGLSADPESEELKKSSNEEGREAHAPVGFPPPTLFGRRVQTHTMVGNGRSSSFSKRLRVAFLPRWRVSPKNACGRAVGRLKALPPFSLSPARESAGESPMCCAFSLWSF
uniref:Helicase C-terminal domain-containing protein n=1 Tax=Salix viminalis TaxID=40686 RepID=A0A6N2MDP8_SALVM